MTYCETCPQLNAAQLKIQGREICDAIGFGKSWVAGMRFFFLCLAGPDLDSLSHLLDQADEHNYLVSAIETDLQSAADQENDLLKDLDAVVKTFSQTKEEIIRAIAQYGAQAHGNRSDIVTQSGASVSCDMSESEGVYRWLIRKSRYLGMQAQALVNPLI